MRVLITGGKGMLGQDLVKTAPKHMEIFALDIHELDITNSKAVKETINQILPERVIHCAAWTDVDGCEKDPHQANLINAVGTSNVAFACKDKKIPLCYISTDFVFDGKKGSPYTEKDWPHPLSVYGLTKWQGEEWVKFILPSWFIVRTSWLFGSSGKNFVSTMLRLAGEASPIKVVNDQRGSPTFTIDLAGALWSLVAGDRFGLYHVTNGGNCTWYEFAIDIFNMAGINCEVMPIISAQLDRSAARPLYSVLSNEMWVNQGFPLLRHYRDGLAAYLELIGDLSNCKQMGKGG